MSSAEGLFRYLATTSLPIPILADPDRTAYAAFGLGRTTWSRLMRPGIIWGYLKLIARGAKVRRVPEGEDALQLGGDFLVSPDRQLIWVHRGGDPLDRPSVEQLLAVIRARVIDDRLPSS